jgi:hypothetical protein
MRLIGLALATAGLAVACAHGGENEARTTTVTSTTITTITSTSTPPVAVVANASPADAKPEMPLASAVCEREALCGIVGAGGRWTDAAACINDLGPRILVDLRNWGCSPAATRARYKDCIASIREEPCTTIVDREERLSVCPGNIACTE